MRLAQDATQVCTECQRSLALSEFHRRDRRCKACVHDRNQWWQEREWGGVPPWILVKGLSARWLPDEPWVDEFRAMMTWYIEDMKFRYRQDHPSRRSAATVYAHLHGPKWECPDGDCRTMRDACARRDPRLTMGWTWVWCCQRGHPKIYKVTALRPDERAHAIELERIWQPERRTSG